MNQQLFFYSAFMLVGVFISSIAQVLLKIEAGKKHGSALSEYLNPNVVCAYTILFIATFISIYSYRVVPLSMGPILEAAGYIFVTAFSVSLLHEKIDNLKIIAIVLICIGIIIYASI